MSDFTCVPDNKITKDLEYDVAVSKFGNGAEQRRLMRGNPERKWTLLYINRTKTEVDQIKAFYDSKKGQLLSFTWTDPDNETEYTVRFDCVLKWVRKKYNLFDLKLEFVEVFV